MSTELESLYPYKTGKKENFRDSEPRINFLY